MTERHDPGDPKVSRLVYELRDAGVRTQAAAIRVIAAREGAGLMPGQIAQVLWQFTAPPEPDDEPASVPGLRPVGPYYVPPGQRDD